MFNIWPLAKIIEERNYFHNDNFIAFCDYMANSHWIGFVKNETGIYKLYNFSEPENIADTFEDAIIMINNNDSELY